MLSCPFFLFVVAVTWHMGFLVGLGWEDAGFWVVDVVMVDGVWGVGMGVGRRWGRGMVDVFFSFYYVLVQQISS